MKYLHMSFFTILPPWLTSEISTPIISHQAQDLACCAFHYGLLEEPRHFSDFASLDEIRLYFKEIHYRLQQQSEKRGTDKAQYVISTAIKYIEGHYNQGNQHE